MKLEMADYTFKQMNNIDSNATTLKEGITQIAKKYGFQDISVNVYSQFGEDQMPMKVVVDGISMVPTLKNGEQVIIQKTDNPKIGDIVVVRDPEEILLIKRLEKINGTQIFLSSDNNDTIYMNINGTVVSMVAIEKWTNASNVVGVAKIFNV